MKRHSKELWDFIDENCGDYTTAEWHGMTDISLTTLRGHFKRRGVKPKPDVGRCRQSSKKDELLSIIASNYTFDHRYPLTKIAKGLGYPVQSLYNATREYGLCGRRRTPVRESAETAYILVKDEPHFRDELRQHFILEVIDAFLSAHPNVQRFYMGIHLVGKKTISGPTIYFLDGQEKAVMEKILDRYPEIKGTRFHSELEKRLFVD